MYCTCAVPLVGHAADNRSYPDLEENEYLDDLHHAMEDEVREREIARARLELEVRVAPRTQVEVKRVVGNQGTYSTT